MPKKKKKFNSPNDDIPENIFLCTDLCTETSSSNCYSHLPTVSEPNADTDIVVVHIISEDKTNRENAITGGGPFK
jgi:hypothetical protein